MVQGHAPRWHVQVQRLREPNEELISLLLPGERIAPQGSSHQTILQATVNQELLINRTITITVIHGLHVLLLQVTIAKEPLEAVVQETRAIVLLEVHPV